MNTYISEVKRDYNGRVIAYKYDSNLTTPVVNMLYRNNTFVPGIERIIFNGLFTKVFFKDGTSVSVKCSSHDTYSKDSAVAFAIFKRVYGKPNDRGEIEGDGFSAYLKKVVNNLAFDQGAYEAACKAKHEAKKAAKMAAVKKSVKAKIPKQVKKSPTPLRDSKGRFLKK